MSSSDDDSELGDTKVHTTSNQDEIGSTDADSHDGATPALFGVDSAGTLDAPPSSQPSPLASASSSYSTDLVASKLDAQNVEATTSASTVVKPVEIDLSQNFELSLSTNEQLFTLLKKSHMDNERLTARVHELERENKRLVSALKQAESHVAAFGSSGGGAGDPVLETPASSSVLSGTPSSRGPSLSTVVAERDAALSEIETLEIRAREAEQNADRMVDAMRQKNDAVTTKLVAAEETVVKLKGKLDLLEQEREQHDSQIKMYDAEAQRYKEESESMKELIHGAEDTARTASRRAQRLQSQTLDLKRRLNQMAQDLLASEEDIKITAQNKTHLEQSVIGLRGEVKSLRGLLQAARTESERERLAKDDIVEKLKLERRQRRREHEANCQRVIELEKRQKKLLLRRGGRKSSSDDTLELAQEPTGRSPMEVELLKAQREESKLKDESLRELAEQVKVSESVRLKLSQRVDTLTQQCGHLEDLNQILLAENTVCIAMLGNRKQPNL